MDRPRAYAKEVEDLSDADLDYAMLVKLYDDPPESTRGCYSPAECTGAKKALVEVRPDPAHVSASYDEHQNLNVRMGVRQFTCLINAFSKKVEAHGDMAKFHNVLQNYVRIQTTLRCSPALAAGVAQTLRSMEDLVTMIDSMTEPPKKSGPHKPRTAAAP